MKALLICIFGLLIINIAEAQVLNKLKDIGKKTEAASKPNTQKPEDPKPATTQINSQVSGSTNTAKGSTGPLAEMSSYYQKKSDEIDNHVVNAGRLNWDAERIEKILAFNHAELLTSMQADIGSHPELFKLYPKKLPLGGGGLITQNNLSDYRSIAKLAGDTEDYPFSGSDALAINQFYRDYIYWYADLLKEEQNLYGRLRGYIAEAASANETHRFDAARLALRQAEAGKTLFPASPQTDDILQMARKNYTTTIDKMGAMISGPFHKSHLQEIVVWNQKPVFGKEQEANLVSVITPGQTAWMTGYFAATNQNLGGLPSVVWLGPADTKTHQDKENPFGYGGLISLPVYSGESAKAEFSGKAYYAFPVFPDLNALPFKSHLEYLPTLHFLKWLSYQNAEVIELQIRFGLVREGGRGIIRIDLSGDNRQKLQKYYDALWQKKLEAVRFPAIGNCADASSSISNLADLNKYGQRLKIALNGTGDIMKPWPNDHEIDWHTANGYGAFETASGKVEVINLEFRKKPGSAQWQWWSVGSTPRNHIVNDKGNDLITPEILNYGYEIMKPNVTSCQPW